MKKRDKIPEEEGAEEAKNPALVLLLRIGTARRITQFLSFLLMNIVVFGFGPWPIVLPVLGSMGAPQKTVAEALGTLQFMLYNSLFPWIALASIFLSAILLGRAFCGWVCPFGLVQDMLEYVKSKHQDFSPRTHQSMINVKYAVLTVVLFISLSVAMTIPSATGVPGYRENLGLFASAPFNALSPADTLFGILPRIVFDLRYTQLALTFWDLLGATLAVPPLLWIRLAIMIGTIVFVVYFPRSWCRYFCPQGAFLALLSRFSFLGLKRDPVTCTKVGCRDCIEACPMKVRILDLPWEKFTDSECIFCLRCVEACSTKAIKPKFA